MKLMASGGNLMRSRACRKGVMPMESNVLLMSWNAIHNSLLFDFASSIMLCRVWIGVFVFPPGNPPKLGPRRILWDRQSVASLVLMIRTVIFLRHSRRIIGRVFSRQNSQSVGLGMGNICDVFQSVGIMDVEYRIPAKDRRSSCTEGCNLFISK